METVCAHLACVHVVVWPLFMPLRMWIRPLMCPFYTNMCAFCVHARAQVCVCEVHVLAPYIYTPWIWSNLRSLHFLFHFFSFSLLVGVHFSNSIPFLHTSFQIQCVQFFFRTSSFGLFIYQPFRFPFVKCTHIFRANERKKGLWEKDERLKCTQARAPN